MSFFKPSKYKLWAEEWGFTYSPQKPLTYPNEWLAGIRDHRLVKIAWGGEKGRRLYVTIRFAGSSSSTPLRESLRQDESLAALPGWKKLKPLAEAKSSSVGTAFPAKPGADYARPGFKLSLVHHDLVVAEKSIVWSRLFSWRRPKPAKVREWVEALLGSLSRSTHGFDDRCELCNSGRVNGFMLFEGTPMMICPGCREREKLEGQMAEQRYEHEEANVTLGVVFAGAGAAVGGAAWAAFTMLTGRIFVVIALGIGLLVAWSYKLGARKIDRVGQIVGALFTVAAVLFGDVVLYAWQMSQARADIGFRMDAGWWAFLKTLQTSPGDIILSVAFGAVGAIVAVNFLRKPRFVPRIESPEEAVAKKKAA